MTALVTLDDIKTYGPIDGDTDDTLLTDLLIPGYLGQIDEYCSVVFGAQTLSNFRPNFVQVAANGALSIKVPTPQINTLTSLEWKLSTELPSSFRSVDVANCETFNKQFGSGIMVLSPSFQPYRNCDVQVRLSGTVGWATAPVSWKLLAVRIIIWAYKKRDAPEERTAIPDVGMIIPSTKWPDDVRQGLTPFVWPF